ncbi:DNA alkylation repair protein [Methanococcus voltae]|uniref:3-methyladenine DNA glycosylase AlkD n=1 Tax=Methanococcus voltae TaxID=2188 RepID=A0A8J7REK5_METVO|nr:DNA alkylation repair protein [Methanococcus voltae]MBP2172300.1 3-methyladenine DNA glycosylase AlkD [Methanococcus voltae]MBP2200744.1 3-methyladenine DNA glycosylase AlkD [Methanococcus voltae]
MKDEFIKEWTIDLKNEIMANSCEERKKATERFFKLEKITGARAPILRKISKTYYRNLEKFLKNYYKELHEYKNKDEINHFIKNDIYNTCNNLFEENFYEYNYLSLIMLHSAKKYYEKEDFEFFSKVLSSYVKNWASCDEFSLHAFYELTNKYPELLDEVFKLTTSENRWVQRSSAVTLIYHIKRNDVRERVFKTADILILQRDVMVEKGIGWLLKVTANNYQEDVYNYVLNNKDKMTRTTLRYAIEKMPQELRKEAMS